MYRTLGFGIYQGKTSPQTGLSNGSILSAAVELCPNSPPTLFVRERRELAERNFGAARRITVPKVPSQNSLTKDFFVSNVLIVALKSVATGPTVTYSFNFFKELTYRRPSSQPMRRIQG